MEHDEIEAGQIPERYLMRQLDAAAELAFEAHYLGCEACQERLRLAEELRQGLREEAARGVAGAAIAAGLLARLVRSRAAPLLATLGLLAVVVLPSGLLWRRASEADRALEEARRELGGQIGRTEAAEAARAGLEAEVAAAEARLAAEREAAGREQARLSEDLAAAFAPQGNVPLALLTAERAAEAGEPTVRLTLPARPGWVVLAAEVEPPAYPRYRATLIGPDGRTLWQGSGLALDARGELVLTVHGSQLGAGDHALRLEGLPAGAPPLPVGRYAFRVLPAP